MVGTRAEDTVPAAPPSLAAEQLPAAGTRVGRYTILERVGSGGMGVVYRAHDPQLQRQVAIKLVRPARMKGKGGAQHKARLLREARAMAQLQHPNVIPVYDVGEHGDALFVAMELVQGSDAAQWVQIEGPPWPRILNVYRAAGRGLAAAHNAGLVHRDFKPANILVGDDQRVRVLDFGLARTAEEVRGAPIDAQAEPDPHWCEAVTSDGVVVGTPVYMAPEQLSGLTADARSDQYSYCVSLWESLFHALPFRGRNQREMARAKVRDQIHAPPRETEVPQALIAALRKGMSSRPEDRFATMPDLLRELRRIADATATDAPPLPAPEPTPAADPRRTTLPWVAFGLAGAVAISLWLQQADDDACRDDADATQLRDAYRTRIADGQAAPAREVATRLAEHWTRRGCPVLAREWETLADP